MSEDKRLARVIVETAAARAALATAAGNVELARMWAAVLVAARYLETDGGKTINPKEAA